LYIRPGNKKGKLALAQAVGRLIRRVPKGTQGYKRIITQERRNYFAKTFNSLRIRMPGHLAGLVKALVSSIQSGPHTVTGIEHILEKKWKKCSRSNCQTKANKGGLCVKHGSRGICRAEGCTLKARVKHLCSSQRCIRRRQAAAGAAGNGVSSSSSSSVAAASDGESLSLLHSPSSFPSPSLSAAPSPSSPLSTSPSQQQQPERHVVVRLRQPLFDPSMFAGAVDGSEEEELEEGGEEEDLPVFSLQRRPESASTSTSG